MTIEVLDLTKISNTFPHLLSNTVRRDGLINGINHYLLNTDTDYLLIEGTHGIGKTTLVSQFTLDNPMQTFTLFINPYANLGYDPDILFVDLERQINWILSGTLSEDDAFLDKASLNRSYSKLISHAKKHQKMFYFVVDGLDEIPEMHKEVRENILELLPVPGEFIKFIFTCQEGGLSNRRFTGTNCRKLSAVPFSLQESKELFNGLIDDDFLTEINITCNGLPEYLVTIKRQIENGLTRDSFSIDLPTKMPELFSLEWEKINLTTDHYLDLLSILTFAKNRQSIDTLAKILGLDNDHVSRIIHQISFVNLAEDGAVSFASESFKNFASAKLRVHKNKAIDKLIDFYMSDIMSVESVLSLPNYLNEAGKYDELLAHLNPENLARVIDTGASIFPIKHHISLGIEASKLNTKNVEIMKFCSQKSVVNGIDKSRSLISEIEALISLQLEDQAVDLAQSTLFQEDLLHSLAIIAKNKVLNDHDVSPELLNQMRSVYSRIDPVLIGANGLSIASELLYSLPDLAIEMADKIIESHNDNFDNEWGITRISLNAIRMDKRIGSKVFEQVNKTIGQKSSEDLSIHAYLLLGDYDANQIIKKANEISDPLNSLSLLRLWILQKRERNDVTIVLRNALERSIQSSIYSPNAYDYRQLASPLPYLSSEEEIRDFINRFDDLKNRLKQTGPSVEYVRLQLLISESEKKISEEYSNDRILELYLYYVNELTDIPTKATCLARILETIVESEEQFLADVDDELISTIKKDFNDSLNTIVENVAEQYDVTKPIIEALSSKFPYLALDYIEKINTDNRRNAAKIDLLENYIEQPLGIWKSEVIRRIVNSISNPLVRENAIDKIFKRFSHQHPKDEFLSTFDYSYLFESLEFMNNPDLICSSLLGYLNFYTRMNPDLATGSFALTDNGRINEIIGKINLAWNKLELSWDKIDLGYKIVTSLSKISKEEAVRFFDNTKNQKQKMETNDLSLSDVYSTCVRLAIRAYSGLLKRRLDNKDDLETIGSAISSVDDLRTRLFLWANVVSCYAISNRTDDAKEIFSKNIHPFMLQLEHSNPSNWRSTLLSIIPVYYVTNPVVAFEEVQKLNVVDQDAALIKLSHFICERVLLSDPYYYYPGNGFELTYEQVIDLINVLSRMRNDSAIYSVISMISDSLCGSSGKKKYTREQRSEIVRRLRKIISEKLPDPNNIRHEGYEIISLSEVCKIDTSELSFFLDLQKRASAIPNLSDRAFVLGIISNNMPSRYKNEKIALFTTVSSYIEKIPSIFDRIDRYLTAANQATETDIQLSKQFINKALDYSSQIEGTASYDIQKEIIDLAYTSINPDFAKGLIDHLDDDPAREVAKDIMKEAYEQRELKKKIGNPREKIEIDGAAENYLAKVCWKLLSELNSKRIPTRNMDELICLLEIASNEDIVVSYPIYAYYIQNTVNRMADTDQASTIIRTLFASLLSTIELTGIIAHYSERHSKYFQLMGPSSDTESSVIIHAGDRDKAIRVLRRWLREAVNEYLIISDPYFSVEDLNILIHIMELVPDCKISILTSRKNQPKTSDAISIEEEYRSHWKRKISDVYPPDCEITLIGDETTNSHPIHDRWWITRGAGLQMGTSYNSIGQSKDSEIIFLDPEESITKENEINRFLNNRIKTYNGKRYLYSSFSL